MNTKPIVLAYSGGLDTSFCIPFLKETFQTEVHAVMADTLGLSADQISALRDKALRHGADHFECLPSFDSLYDRILSYLIKGNVLRDRTYPLSVGAERFIQAEQIAEYAKRIGTHRIAHGSTGAGNDQIRFDVALYALIPDVEIITPIRDHGFTRSQTTAFLRERGFDVADKTTNYSVNDGIWGTTIGGKETMNTTEALPFDAFPALGDPMNFNEAPELVRIGFEFGLPVSINGEAQKPFDLLKNIQKLGRKHGIGRAMHLGDTILGIKGRIGFEAPVAHILYFAHRELEKLVLTKWQRQLKDQQSDTYGMLLHEGQFYDPVMRDIEAFLDSSQQRVSGEVTLYLGRGVVFHQTTTSPNTLIRKDIASYGEDASGWTGAEARAFSKLTGITSKLANSIKS